jgi:SpoVK/Ycf46/Vps4 family AAA+-type ATPase
MALAHTVCSLDAHPSPSELAALDRFRGTLLRTMEQAGLSHPGTGAPVRTAAPTADVAPVAPPQPESPPRPLEELLAELEGLVGLAGVKAEVRLVVNLITVQNMRKERHLPVAEQSRHLVFTGNPGTGKTTVARLLAQVYRTLKVVEKGQLVETDRAGLVAGYVGQTAAKVTQVFDRAIGGALLVDEAYALARGGDNDFGQEAIDTLVKLIEDHRDDIVVIAAGYPDEMADFIGSNPGLESRFPKTIAFPDYTDDELVAIFVSLCDRNAYTVSDDARAVVRAWFAAQARDKGFGNGRLARNLFEAAVARQASRIVALQAPSDADLCALTAADIGMP